MPNRLLSLLAIYALFVAIPGCAEQDNEAGGKPEIPRGFLSSLAIEVNNRVLRFGPFVGYYFRPKDTRDLTRLEFVCFNEGGFYTDDWPPGKLLFKGDARLVRLPVETIPELSREERMKPVFAGKIPKAWLETRPDPVDEFVHFHSCYDATGPVPCGYWLRHVAQADFTYDMGGRVGVDSPLYHPVTAGVDKSFAKIVEFDRGPIQK